MNDNLVKEFEFFTENHDELFAKYPNKFVVLKDKAVVLTGDSFEDAYAKALDSGLILGSFLIQECTQGDSAYTQTFLSRVVFA